MGCSLVVPSLGELQLQLDGGWRALLVLQATLGWMEATLRWLDGEGKKANWLLDEGKGKGVLAVACAPGVSIENANFCIGGGRERRAIWP